MGKRLELPVGTKVAKQKKTVCNHVARILLKWMVSAAISGAIPIWPALMALSFGETIQDKLLLDCCGFYFGLTGTEMVYELLAEPLIGSVEDMWGFASKVTSLVMVVLFGYVFFALSGFENYSKAHWRFVMVLGTVGILLTCVKKGYAEGKRYVSNS